jgi:hypothetical protein
MSSYLDNYSLKSKYIPSLLILLIYMNSFVPPMIDVLASSPSFPRQSEIEPTHEWQYFSLTTNSNCTGIANIDQIPDIRGVSYFSDGKVLNATIWLSGAFEGVPIPSAIRIPTYVMGIGIIQSYNTSAKVDYAVTVQWNPISYTWSSTVEEFLANGTRTLQQNNNYTDFDNTGNNGHVNLSLDLGLIGSPAQYFLSFYAFDTAIQERPACGLVDVIGHVFYVPPPDFSISVFPNPLQIRPGEERTIELRTNSSTIVNPLLSIPQVDKSHGLEISINPNRTFIPPGGMATSLVKVKANDSAEIGPHTIGIYPHISFPITFNAAAVSTEFSRKVQQTPIFAARIFESKNTADFKQTPDNSILNIQNKSSEIIPRPSYFSVIVNPYSLEERFKDFWNIYGGMLSLIGGGFAAGFSALIIDRIKNKRTSDHAQKDGLARR